MLIDYRITCSSAQHTRGRGTLCSARGWELGQDSCDPWGFDVTEVFTSAHW
jgi:hypothetical protein